MLRADATSLGYNPAYVLTTPQFGLFSPLFKVFFTSFQPVFLAPATSSPTCEESSCPPLLLTHAP